MHKEPSIFELIMDMLAIVILGFASIAIFCIIVVCIIEAFSRFGALGGVVCLWAFVSMMGYSKSC